VKITDVSSEWEISGVLHVLPTNTHLPPTNTPRPPPISTRRETHELAEVLIGATHRDDGGRLRVSAGPSRWLVLTRAERPDTTEYSELFDASEWCALDIAAGLPQVYAATSEAFVAQMLNLDLIDAIAFDKGCYTGQEVIARAHYRGKVKRRMQRFQTREAARLAAGDVGTLSDGRSFRVVDAVQRSEGRCEFLAVTTFGDAEDAAGDASVSASSDQMLVNAEQLVLPYSLPA
jgi:folate-binding protein YgfZ